MFIVIGDYDVDLHAAPEVSDSFTYVPITELQRVSVHRLSSSL